MLATQVQYWNLKETQRHNAAMESQAANELKETQRRNLEVERQGRDTIAENQRHNQEVEKTNWFSANESARHNKEQEKIGWSNLEESKRHNQVQESIADRNTAVGEAMLPFNQSESQMKTTTGYVNAAANAGKNLGNTMLSRSLIAGSTLVGMGIASGASISSKTGSKSNQKYISGSKSTTKNSSSHYANRPSGEVAKNKKYWRY